MGSLFFTFILLLSFEKKFPPLFEKDIFWGLNTNNFSLFQIIKTEPDLPDKNLLCIQQWPKVKNGL